MDARKEQSREGGREREKEGRREGKKKIDWKSHFLFWCPITLKRFQCVSYKSNPLWHYHHTTDPFRKPSHRQCCFPIHRLYFNFANDHINVSFSLLVQILVERAVSLLIYMSHKYSVWSSCLIYPFLLCP